MTYIAALRSAALKVVRSDPRFADHTMADLERCVLSTGYMDAPLPHSSTLNLLYVFAANLRNAGGPGVNLHRFGDMVVGALAGLITENRIAPMHLPELAQRCLAWLDSPNGRPLVRGNDLRYREQLRALAKGDHPAVPFQRHLQSVVGFIDLLNQAYGGCASIYHDSFSNHDSRLEPGRAVVARLNELKHLSGIGVATGLNFIKDSQIPRFASSHLETMLSRICLHASWIDLTVYNRPISTLDFQLKNEMKTSETDPLFVNELSVGQGVLGLTFCPGKQDTGMDGTQWHRDLHADLQALAEWGAIHVVSIIQHDELEILGVPQLGVEVRARGMHWHHFPVLDQSIPNRDNFPQFWANLTKVLQSELAVGKKVVFHCRGGLGCTGLVAALLLMDLGSSARDAIAAVRAARSPRAIETREQEEYVRRYKPYLSHASLLGGAIGDSLGADIEFMNLDEIRAAFPDGVNRLSGDQVGKPGWFTDDTQMTLFTAEGLVLYHALQSVNGYASCPQVVHQALLRWLATQDEQPVLQATTASVLISDPRIWYQAAPGMTCLEALRIGSPANNASKGCGTIMRVAPIALGLSETLISEFANRTSALTHGHPVGQLAATAWANLLARVAEEDDLGGAAHDVASQMVSYSSEAAEVGWAMRAAMEAKRDGCPERLEKLGAGWIAEEALAIALYACLCAEDFEHGLRIAVTHSGDSDSTGAIAGNMLGLLYPNQVFSHPWAGQVGGRDIIAKLAVDLPLAQYWTPEIAASQLLGHPLP